MAWTKMKTIGVSVAILLLGGAATTMVVKKESTGGEAAAADDPVARLRTQLAGAGGTPEQIDNVVCVDNLKKIGAALAGATAMPGDPLALRDKLDTPRRFHCPKDAAKTAPARWSDLRVSNISYVFSGAARSPGDPAIVRCPIHGHALMPGGQVIQGGLMPK
jgi:hypothetical protein